MDFRSTLAKYRKKSLFKKSCKEGGILKFEIKLSNWNFLS